MQCRRVVLPYLFVRYCWPAMQEAFGGELSVVLVQHEARTQRFGRLKSTQLGQERQQLVRRWTEEGRYAGAEIVRHDEWHEPYPSLPSVRHCAEIALAKGADFHLWMEDDTLVLDRECGSWETRLGSAEVGVYRSATHLINSCFFVSRPRFDQRLLPRLRRLWTFQRFSRLESWLRKMHPGEPAVLKPEDAVRDHHKEYPFTGMRYLVDKVLEIAPDEVGLLEIDFGQDAQRELAGRGLGSSSGGL